MNVKKVLLLAAALSLSSHAFALEIYNGKVLNKKVWSTDGSKAALKVNKALRGPQMHREGFTWEDTWAQVFSAAAKVNQPIEINNSNHIIIQNESDESREYGTVQSVCSDTSEKTAHCVHYFEEIQLNPGGYISDDLHPVLEMTYTKPGKYRIWTITSYNEAARPSSYSMSTGVMTVS